MKTVDAKKGIIVIEDNKPDAIEHLKALAGLVVTSDRGLKTAIRKAPRSS